MIDHPTRGILTAGTWARINTLVVQAGLAAIAVGVRHAFGSAGNVRIAEVLRQTRARSDAVTFVAHGVRATRGWITRCTRLFRCNGCCV